MRVPEAERLRSFAASSVAILAALLTAAVTPAAFAQPRRPASAAQAAAIAGQLGAWDAYAWMRAAQAQQYATRLPPAQLEQAQAQYFTNGAAVMSVPSTGPGAAYFSNGAEVLAAPTTSWVEGPLATPEPSASTATASEPDGGAPPTAPSASASAVSPANAGGAPAAPASAATAAAEPTPAAAPPPPQGSAPEAGSEGAPSEAPTTGYATGAPPPPLPPGVTMMQGPGPAGVPAGKPAGVPATSEAAAPHAARAAVHAQKSSWLVPVAGGFVAFAFVALFAERLLRRRPTA